MTAHEFIRQLFERPGYGCASNMRRLTPRQLELLVELIGQDSEGGAVQRGMNGSFVWMPSGREKYVVTRDPQGRKHTLMRLPNLVSADSPRLF